MVDQNAMKGVIFIPTNKMVSMAEAACLYYEKVYMRFGLPDKIISDRDPAFRIKLIPRTRKTPRCIKLAMSTVYHPQTDGETERVNQELKIYLQMFCSNEPETWKRYLPTAEFAHNQKTHSAVKHSPFYLMMGYEPLGLPTAFPKTNVPEAEKRLSALFRARNEAQAAHKLA
jgi:transposase InsO family protein